jgi:glutaredoxin
MKRMILVVTLLAATGSLVAAQLYRWVDDKGNVESRDTPPPPSAKKVEERRLGGNTIQTSTPSYTVQQAAKNYPVTLWAYDCGDPCNNARAHLARRGVPYAEKDPREDLKGFEKLMGSTNVPVLYVGSARLTGYLESAWDNTLDSAGYPRTAAAAGVYPAGKPAPKPAAKPGEEPKPTAEQKPAPADKPVAAAPDRSVPYPKPAK